MAIENPVIERSQFGSGRAGDRAFEMISSGIACNNCGKKASQTIDFDIPRIGDLEQIPVCNPCSPIVGDKIRKDLNGSGFSSNGWGRA